MAAWPSGVDLHGDVAERRRGEIGIEEILVGLVRELEERQGAAIGEAEERVAVDALRAEQFVGLGPGGEQREPEDVLVEGPRGLLVLGDIGGVVEAQRGRPRSGCRSSCSGGRCRSWSSDPSFRRRRSVAGHAADMSPLCVRY